MNIRDPQLGKAALKEIDTLKAAIKRIEAGTYGICTSCGDGIGKDRLKAVPHAAKCLNCAK